MEFDLFLDKFSAKFPVSIEQWKSVQDLFQLKTFHKNDFFIKAQDEPKQLGLISKGLFRLYYTDQNGKEWVRNFQTDGGILAAYAEIIEKKPSRTYIQALTESNVLICNHELFQQRTNGIIAWEVLQRKVLEQLYIKKENREYELLHLSAGERYELFLKEYESVARDIPSYHVASYLGITPQALSRIRNSQK